VERKLIQEKESPKIAHSYRCRGWFRFKNQFLHTFLSPGSRFRPPVPRFPRVSHVHIASNLGWVFWVAVAFGLAAS